MVVPVMAMPVPVAPVMAVPVVVAPMMMPMVTPADFFRLQAIDVVLRDHRGFRALAARRQQGLFN